MKARNCCKTMEAELTAWKANVYDIARKMESIIGDEREKILPNIEDLHILIAEMDDQLVLLFRVEHLYLLITIP